MGVRILNGDGEGDSQGAVLYDSVSGWAFGPVFAAGYDEAQDFLDWLRETEAGDARMLSDYQLKEALREWRYARQPQVPGR